MKALILAARGPGAAFSGIVEITANGTKAAEFAITPETSDVVHMAYLKRYTRPGANEIEMRFEGEGSVFYQIITQYSVPWEFAPPPEREQISIDLSYDRTTLRKDDTVQVLVRVSSGNTFPMAIVDLGIPPGFEVLRGDLQALRERGVIARYDLTPRQIILYIDRLERTKPLEFSYRLRAKYPLKAKTPPSSAYAYYNPEIRGTEEPVEVCVE